ncbi:hypothetical protein LENED_006965 [Lentinula edodes]|uniref:Uncharacterized protein n=1 Tax=Lentinula edodes TaxID=5353 RepID=A0A1Q3ED69_LENED|nr:hypothetical protein LENED_006965 [Lentinula edodes]
MILAMRLLLFWIPMVQISSVQSQNVNFPIGNVLGSNAIVSFIHNLETKAESNTKTAQRYTTACTLADVIIFHFHDRNSSYTEDQYSPTEDFSSFLIYFPFKLRGYYHIVSSNFIGDV